MLCGAELGAQYIFLTNSCASCPEGVLFYRTYFPIEQTKALRNNSERLCSITDYTHQKINVKKKFNHFGLLSIFLENFCLFSEFTRILSKKSIRCISLTNLYTYLVEGSIGKGGELSYRKIGGFNSRLNLVYVNVTLTLWYLIKRILIC